MEIKILTDEQLPEAIGLARGVFDYCLRNTIPNPKMVQAFEQYIHQDYLKHMINEGYLVMWGAYEQNTIAILQCCISIRCISAAELVRRCCTK